MDRDTFTFIQAMTRSHREVHGCGAYTFEDGPGLVRIARAHGARRLLEFGTALGYTACCLASADPESQVDTVEADPEHVRIARENIAKAGLGDRVTAHQGDFAVVAAELPSGYDLAFLDGFAPDVALLALLRRKLAEGGLLLCSNLGYASAESLAELDDIARWNPAGSIEDGGTRAFLKIGNE